MNIDEVSTRAFGQPRKNILNSLLWLSGVTFPSGSFAVTFGPWPGSLIPFTVGCLPVLASIWYYRHWSNRDPDRLQTEGFRLQKDAIAQLGQNRVGHSPLVKTILDQPTVGNPNLGLEDQT